MVSLAVIASATQNPNPDLPAILRYLEEQAEPVAEEKNPLKIIAPVVSRLHARSRTMQFELTSKKLNETRLRNAVARGFGEVMDLYIALFGIAPPPEYAKALEFSKEKDFAHKLLEISFRLYKAIGGTSEFKWIVVMPPLAIRENFSAELKVLRETYPLPDFASQENMARRGAKAAVVAWVSILVFIGFKTGILPFLIVLLFKGCRD